MCGFVLVLLVVCGLFTVDSVVLIVLVAVCDLVFRLMLVCCGIALTVLVGV